MKIKIAFLVSAALTTFLYCDNKQTPIFYEILKNEEGSTIKATLQDKQTFEFKFKHGQYGSVSKKSDSFDFNNDGTNDGAFRVCIGTVRRTADLVFFLSGINKFVRLNLGTLAIENPSKVEDVDFIQVKDNFCHIVGWDGNSIGLLPRFIYPGSRIKIFLSFESNKIQVVNSQYKKETLAIINELSSRPDRPDMPNPKNIKYCDIYFSYIYANREKDASNFLTQHKSELTGIDLSHNTPGLRFLKYINNPTDIKEFKFEE